MAEVEATYLSPLCGETCSFWNMCSMKTICHVNTDAHKSFYEGL